MKPKDKEKLVAEIQYACSRLAPYLQPLAYMFLPLYEDGGAQLVNNGRVALQAPWMKIKTTLTDAELCETQFKDREKERKTGKKEKSGGKQLPGAARFDVRRLTVRTDVFTSVSFPFLCLLGG